MTQTLDAILKTTLLTNSGIPISKLFTQTIVDLLPDTATVADAIEIAQTLYLQTSGLASILPAYRIAASQIPENLHNFSDPYARQSVSDFSYLIRDVVVKDTSAARAYATFRSSAILHETFATYLPKQKTPELSKLVAA